MARPKTIGAGEIETAIARVATAISKRHSGAENLLLLGIANGGVELSRRLAQQLAAGNPSSTKKSRAASGSLQVARGILDISFHRDDIGRHPIPKEYAPTQIPSDVNGATVIIVDDVLFSGRTVKAALDELFDHGRPMTVELAVLVDRGGRRLPLAADYSGLTLDVEPDKKVVIRLDPTDSKKDTLLIRPA